MNNFVNKNSFLGLLLSAIVCLTWISCSKDDEEEVEGPKYSVARVDTYTISPPFVYGMYLVNNSQASPYVENTWSSKGGSFHVFVLQGNTFTDLGTLHSKETSIASADRQKPVHVEVPIPTSIDVNKSYQIIATSGVSPVLSNGRIVCDIELKRDSNTYCPSWYLAQGGSSANSQSNYLNVFEILYVRNNTGKPIKVRHMGFDTVDKWYCTKGKVSIGPSLKAETTVESTIGEMASQEKTILANEKSWLESCYVPTGKKMSNARVILEIDGKQVKTPAVSSDVSIENGIPYFMAVKWDGTSLEWD